MAHFYESIQGNRIPLPVAAEGLVKVVDAAYESAKTGEVVMLANDLAPTKLKLTQ